MKLSFKVCQLDMEHAVGNTINEQNQVFYKHLSSWIEIQCEIRGKKGWPYAATFSINGHWNFGFDGKSQVIWNSDILWNCVKS